MALAFVDLSRDAMALQPPSFLNASEYLERALKLLQEEGASSLAPDLRSQIDETLEEIAPRCVLERLALPLDEDHRKMREEGLVGVRTILWAVGGGGAAPVAGGLTREDFMSKAFALMTTWEQVDLFNTTPENIPPEEVEAYSVAVAIVAQAFVGKKPSLIPNASNLFEQLQKQSNNSTDFALERGMCSLLVGKVEECRMWLGLDSEDSPYRDPSILAFVEENCGGDDEESDLRGLCRLLETWLGEVVFPRFRDCEAITFKLGDYYDDPSVLRYLERMEGDGASPLSAAAAIVKIGAEEATAVIGHVKASATVALQKVFPVSKKEEEVSSRSMMVMGGIVAVGVVAVALALVGMRGRKGESAVAVAATAAGEVAAAGVGEEVGEKMSASVAESVVRRWQRVKSEAMGPEHKVDGMEEVLGGEMLRVWMDRAAEVKARGWDYTYSLFDLSIESVSVAIDGKRALVEASLTESTTFRDSLNSTNNSSNVRTYTARYDMALTQSSWKIVDGALII